MAREGGSTAGSRSPALPQPVHSWDRSTARAGLQNPPHGEAEQDLRLRAQGGKGEAGVTRPSPRHPPAGGGSLQGFQHVMRWLRDV